MKCNDCKEEIKVGDWPFDCRGLGHQLGSFFSGDAQIHTSEKVTVMHNPTTGETRIPGRADRPIHRKYQKSGFTEYKTIDTHQQLRQLEKQKGVVHEQSTFNSLGNQL